MLQQQEQQHAAALTQEELAVLACALSSPPPAAGLQGTQHPAFLQHPAAQHSAGNAATGQHQAQGEQGVRLQLQLELAALAEGLGAGHQQHRAGDSSSTANASSSVTDLLLAVAAHQPDSLPAVQQLLASQQQAGLLPASTAELLPPADEGQSLQSQQQQQQVVLTSAGHPASSAVLSVSVPLALSLGAAGELPLLQVSHSGGMQAVLPVTSLGMPGSSTAAATATGGPVTSIQALQTLQLVQLPNGQLRALQPSELQALLQHQQQHQQQQHHQQQHQQHEEQHQHQQHHDIMLGFTTGGASANGFDMGAQQQQGHQQQQDQPPAKRQRTDASLSVLSNEEAAAELAGLHQAAEKAAEAAVARAASGLAGSAAASAGGAAPHADGAAAAGLAALQQLLGASGGTALLQQPQALHADAAGPGAGLVISIGGVNMIIPAASQMQLAALVGQAADGGGPGVSDVLAHAAGHHQGASQHQQQQQQDGALALQQQLQLVQLPLGGGGDVQQQGGGGGAAAGAAAVPEIDQGALQQQMQQIQQLQQIQLMQLQLAAQQGQLVGVPPGSGGGGALAQFGLEDGTETGHMVRRHGVLPERLVTKDMLKQVFNLPIEEAAKQLGIGQTMLKHYCRKFNIPRWPYRKRQSVVQLIQSIQEYTQSPADAHAVEPALQKLRSFLAAIDEDPNLDLDGPIKKLRQAFFKEAYKNRQRLRQQQEVVVEEEEEASGGARGGRKEGWLEGLCQAILDSSPIPSATQLPAAQLQEQPGSTELSLALQQHDGLGDMHDGQVEHQHSHSAAAATAAGGGYQTAAAAAAAAAGGSSGVDSLAAMQQAALTSAAAAGGGGGHGQLDHQGCSHMEMDPEVVAAHLATVQQLQEFQRAGLGCGVEGLGVGLADAGGAAQAGMQAGRG